MIKGAVGYCYDQTARWLPEVTGEIKYAFNIFLILSSLTLVDRY